MTAVLTTVFAVFAAFCLYMLLAILVGEHLQRQHRKLERIWGPRR